MEEPEGIDAFLDPPRQSRLKRVMFFLSGAVIIFALGFMLLVIFWLMYPYKIATIKEPIPILNKNNAVAVGDNLILRVEVEKFDDVYPTRAEYISCDDSSLTFLEPSGVKNVPPGKYIVINEDVVVPRKLVPGSICKFHFQYSYQVNPIRTVTKEWDTESFRVLPEGG